MVKLRPTTFAVVLLATSGSLACKRPGNAVTAQPPLGQLVDSLARLPGTFVLEGAAWRFEGSQNLFVALAGGADSAIARLVDCMDRTEPTLATAAGNPVLLGAMCSYALRHIAYAAEFEDDPDANWPGLVGPTADQEQLRAAKRAWQEVVRLRRYRLT